MKKRSITALIIAAVLLILGAVLLGTAWFLGARPTQLSEIDVSGIFPWINAPVISADNGRYRDWANDYAADGQYAAPVNGVNGISLSWLAGDVRVQAYEGADIAFTETSDEDFGADEALRWGIEGGTLYIQYCPPQTTGDLPSKNLTLLLPSALAGELDSFAFSGVSAGLTASGLNARSLSASSTSGELDFTESSARRVDLSSVSGSQRFSGGFSELDASSTSGDLFFETAERGSVEVSSISGQVTVRGSVSRINANTTSGDVEIGTDLCPDHLEIDSLSGMVRLALPGDCGFTLEFDTVSGALTSDFPVVLRDEEYVCGDGAARIDVDTTSGDVELLVQAG